MRITGAQATIEALRREGVEYVFGLPGTTIMHLIDALVQQEDVRYIPTRHEQVAAFMADGYARGSGNLGVCMASRGPGAANLAIGLHNSYAESVPVLALVGQVADEIYYREAMMRSSEAPSLTKRPSEYMREFYYTSQPMEFTGNMDALRVTFEMMDAENRLMYSSDYPHWDFDLPSKIYDLPFLSEETKRKILGGNALELFGINDEVAAKRTFS